MKRFKKLVTGILAVVMLATAIPLSASGAEIDKNSSDTPGWNYNNNTVAEATGCTAKIVGSDGYGGTETYNDVANASGFEAVAKKTTHKRIRLVKNIKLSAKTYYIKSNTLLQLNGKTLTVPRGGKLIISGTNIEIKGNNKGDSMGVIVGDDNTSTKSETSLIDIAGNSNDIRFYNIKITSSKMFSDTIRIGSNCNKISVLNSIIRQYGTATALKICGASGKYTKNIVTTNMDLASNGTGIYTNCVSGLGIGGNTDCSVKSIISGKTYGINSNNSSNIYVGRGNKKTSVDGNNKGIGIKTSNCKNITLGGMSVCSDDTSKYTLNLTNDTSNVMLNSLMTFAGKAPHLNAQDTNIIKITAPSEKDKKTLSRAKFDSCTNISILKCVCTNLSVSNSSKFGIGSCDIKGTTSISNSNQFYVNYESNLYGKLNINNSKYFKLCNVTVYNIISVSKSSVFTMNSTLVEGKTTNEVYIELNNCSGSNHITTKIPIK